MKKGALLLVVLSLLLSCLIGCSGQRDVEKAPQQHGESIIAEVPTHSEQAPTESAQPTEPMPAEDHNDPEENGSTFPTLPEVIDDENNHHSDVSLHYGWMELYPEIQEKELAVDFSQMSFDEAYDYYLVHGPFYTITNDEGEVLDLDPFYGAERSPNTTMEILSYVPGGNSEIVIVPYHSSFCFTTSNDDRPCFYVASWEDFSLSVDGEHLGDVRLTVGGACFSGTAKDYVTEKPMKYRVQARRENRTLIVSGEDAAGFLLTREGDRLTVLASHDCEVGIREMDLSAGSTKTLLTETVPAGTRWYVEDLTAPEDELKTGLLP